MGAQRNQQVQENEPEEKPIQRRKKSVHFPANYVQPIDDSSYENSSSENIESKNRFVDRKLSDTSSEDLRVAAKKQGKKHGFLKATSQRYGVVQGGKKEAVADKKGEGGWRQERAAFVAAMRISRKIKQVENDPNLGDQET